MAMSGTKLSRLFGSASTGSAEDFDHKCDPCLTAGEHVEAYGFCLDCEDFLCKTCFKHHERTKASRDHKLADRDSTKEQGIPKTQSDTCTEMCEVHKVEPITFFCRQHEELGCRVCMTLNHRTCDLDYIPDVCENFRDSEEYQRTIWLLNQKIKEVKDVVEKATERRKNIDASQEDLIKEMDKFQLETNDRVQLIRNELVAEADKKKSDDKQTVQSVLESCANVFSDISKLQASLQDNRTLKQNEKLYIAIKQAESKLKSNDLKKLEQELEKTNMQYAFEHNKDLLKMLSTKQ